MQASNQRVNQVSDNPYGDGSINNWLNPSAFAQPALGTYGTSKRNAYDRSGLQEHRPLARAVGSDLPRSHRIEARIEAFNALNWFIPGNPSTVLSAATFGRITSFSGGADPRVMQFAVKYVF